MAADYRPPITAGTQAAIDAEASARASADTALAGTVTAEAVARATADSAEATARANAIAAAIAGPTADIAAETTARIAADTTLTTAVGLKASSAALTAETAARTTEDARTDNPHAVTKTQVGLGNVDNTSDVNKPVSTAVDTRFLAVESRSPESVRVVRVSGDGVTNANATINAALALGIPEVVVTSFGGDVVMISASLTIPSNTHLRLAPNVKLTKPRLSYFPMIVNTSVTPTRTATDGAVGLLGSVVTTSLAAFAVVGQPIQVYQAGEDNATYGRASLYGNITAVNTGAGTITLDRAASVAKTGATVYLYARDRNIEISGGTWDGTDAGLAFVPALPAGDHGYRHGNMMHLRRIDGFKMHDLHFAGDGNGYAGFYACHPADIRGGWCWNITAGNTAVVDASVGTAIQTQGPCSDFHIHDVSGFTNDDMIAHVGIGLGPRGDTDGDYTNCTVDGIGCTGGGYNGVKISTGIGAGARQMKFAQCTVSNVHGDVVNYPVAFAGFTNPGQFDVQVSDVTGRSTGGNNAAVIVDNAITSRIGLRNISHPASISSTPTGVIDLDRWLKLPKASNEAVTFNIASKGVYNCTGSSSPMDIAKLTPLDGDTAVNNNALLPCGTGQVAYDLVTNTWKHRHTGLTWTAIPVPDKFKFSAKAMLDQGYANGNAVNPILDQTALHIDASQSTAANKPTLVTALLGNERQSVTLTGQPTGGTFTLTYGGNTTTGIAPNATAATVQATLEALASIGGGNVVCSGGPLPAPVTCEFRGTLAFTNLATMTASAASLTGGVAPGVTVAVLTDGAGIPALRFDGTNDQSDTALSLVTQSLVTVYAVVIPRHLTKVGIYNLATSNVSIFQFGGNWYAGSLDSGVAIVVGTPRIIIATFNGPSSILNVNNADVAGTTGYSGSGVLSIGKVGGTFGQMDIAELWGYGALHTATQRANIRAELSRLTGVA